MFRSLIVLAAGLSLPLVAAGQTPPQVAVPPAEPALLPRDAPVAQPVSRICFAEDRQAISGFDEKIPRSRAMVDALVCAVTGQREVRQAWRSLVKPEDRVGIKVSTVGGASFSSHHGVVLAIVSGLLEAGVAADRIIVWDRNTSDLREAGYLPPRGRYQVRAIDPPRGFDREATFEAPLLGKLAWGDLLFMERQRVPFGKVRTEDDQLTNTSHLARVVSREVTKVINVPVLSEHRACGVAGAIFNMSVPNVDNGRRFLQTEGSLSSSPAEAFIDERLSGKCVLHILDGLVAQFAGGPTFEPNYAFAHATIYASKDPVALDATALRRIDSWRANSKLPPVGKRAKWLEDAAGMGLGHFAEDQILLEPVAVPR